MAPSRRRGVSKASAAAAARRQWKVGDLVLAKVKGFPAWPATVSEPEKWGYSTDWKKVLVYFFGTKQIAFCNPADVEAFTEEKKKTLLTKRQGKGADFVRAVQEIIASFEKSKAQQQDDRGSSDHENIVSNDGHCEGYGGKSGDKFQVQSPVRSPVLVPSRLESLCASSHQYLEVSAEMEIDERRDMKETSEEPAENAPCFDHKENSHATNSLLEKSSDTLLQSFVRQKRASARRSRSTSKVDPSRFQNHLLQFSDRKTNSIELLPSAVNEESTRRNRRNRKLLESSVWHDTLSPDYKAAGVSNGSCEDNNSETVPTNSDAVSISEGSTLESSYKSVFPEVVDYLERDVQLSDRLNFRDETVVLKKKRKPNRKRVALEVTTPSFNPNKESGFEVPVSIIKPIPPNCCEKVQEQTSRADGDEHLPLVKRARVRMGKPPAEEKQLTPLEDKEGKRSENVMVNCSQPVSLSSVCANNLQGSISTSDVKENVTGSPLQDCVNQTEKDPLFWKAKKYQLHGSLDGEAALPPSKRLNRALEAMTANAVEDGRAYTEAEGTPKVVFSSGGSGSSEKSSSHTSEDDKDRSALDVEDEDSLGENNTCMRGACGSAATVTLPNVEAEAISSSEIKPGDPHLGCSTSPKHVDVAEVMINTKDLVDVKDVRVSSDSTSSPGADTNLESPRSLSSSDRKQGGNDSSLGSSNQASPVEKGEKHSWLGQCKESSEDIVKVERACPQEKKPGRGYGATSPQQERVDSAALEVNDVGIVSTLSGSDTLVLLTNGDSGKKTECLMSPPEENVKRMCEVIKEVKYEVGQRDIEAAPQSMSMKVLIAAAQAKRDSSRASLSDNPILDKVVGDAVASPTVANRNFLLYNGSGSPDVLPHLKKVTHGEMDEGAKAGSSFSLKKSSRKWMNSEANAARRSFESMLEILTRTKESIGRATRLAIDCAKYGIASEVLEILVRNLESQSSLHRRVDLFFLVDSITQCSRSQKGEVGEMFPSAVQAMLPRLLAAAAPPGNAARENRRQCLKVLRLWLERKTLPECIIRHHMRELDSIGDASFSSGRSRRPSRMERAMDDPIRQMEGMLVDEYGSNSSFHLPGFSMPRMLEDEEGSDADEKSFEAVTPEHDLGIERGPTPTSAIEKHCHILEDVDGELEMEDVAPSYEVGRSSGYDVPGVNTVPLHIKQSIPLPFAPPLPEDHPPSPPPLPNSPPPMPPPLPRTPSAICHPFNEYADPNLYTSTHQPGPPSVKSMVDPVQHYAPGYRDFGKQTQRPSSSIPSSSSCSFPVPQPSIQNGNSVQHVDAVSLRSQSCHVQPPPPTLSNQFSYVQTDQRRQSWMEASSSSTKSFHDLHRETRYDSRERMDLVPYEIGERCKVAAPVYSGPVHSDKPEASYPPVSHYGPPSEPRILNRGWSFPPRALNYLHPTPSRPPECTTAGANGAPKFWIPR